jgi:Ti-type conjugative transfer relaxase TraA
MIPKLHVGKGVTGAVRYVLGEGRDPASHELKELKPGQQSRVDWIGGTGFGAFEIKTKADAELACRIMEFAALNQTSKTRRCEQDCLHLSLSWHPGETPTRADMEAAGRDALKAIGMGNARAIFVAHRDEDHPHVHIVASKINPETGQAYDLKASYRKLSDWALDYERAHGGVMCLRRQDSNELRTSIHARDASGVLKAMTAQRSTFTAKQLENALRKEIRDPLKRAQFGNEILAKNNVIQLADQPGGPITRYTTREVLQAEHYVLRAAEGLAINDSHMVDRRRLQRVIEGEKFATMRDDQLQAFWHATRKSGLVLIDGQAGTGKSYTIAAIREAYEAQGYRAVGLGPSNKVANTMRKDGFAHAATIHSELFKLNNPLPPSRSGKPPAFQPWDSKTVVFIDEAAMVDTKLMAMVTAHAHDAGAKLILVGDARQLPSISRGGMFGSLKDRHSAAELSIVTRQNARDERQASQLMAKGNFKGALEIYDKKGRIHWTRTQREARAALRDQWAKDNAANPNKSRFVFAYTNADVNTLNADLRQVMRDQGRLGADRLLDTAHGLADFATGDRIQFTAKNKTAGIDNNDIGTITALDGGSMTVQLDGGRSVDVNPETCRDFRHAYAGTIHKGQGDTLDQAYLFHSEHWRSAASYVALTRHRDKVELFVATNSLNMDRAAEPWMMETGGAAALSQEKYDSAQRSFEQWKLDNPGPAAYYGFASYVQYVQDKWTQNPQNETGKPELTALARQMGRVDDRRAATAFYAQQDIGPVRPMTAREILESFAEHDATLTGDNPQLKAVNEQPRRPTLERGESAAQRDRNRDDNREVKVDEDLYRRFPHLTDAKTDFEHGRDGGRERERSSRE